MEGPGERMPGGSDDYVSHAPDLGVGATLDDLIGGDPVEPTEQVPPDSSTSLTSEIPTLGEDEL